MRFTTPQYLLIMALAISVIMAWVSAADHSWTCVMFIAETIVSMWLLYGSLHRKKAPEAEE